MGQSSYIRLQNSKRSSMERAMGSLIGSRNFQSEYVTLDQRRGPHSGAACGLRLTRFRE